MQKGVSHLEIIKKKDSNEEYHSSGYLGKSKLANLLITPYHFKYALENPQPPTSALELGTAFHCLVLEPSVFEKEYYVLPQGFTMCSKENKELYQQIVENGLKPIKSKDYDTICKMRDSVVNTKFVNGLLNGEHEISYYAEDEQTGVKVSCRCDSRRDIGENEGVIVDLKTCTSASPDNFTKDAVKYHYDMQSYQYKSIIDKYEGKPHRFVFICVEKTPPYAVGIYEASDLFLQHGKDLYRECVGLYKHCSETNDWFSYNGEDKQINQLGLPSWLAKDLQ